LSFEHRSTAAGISRGTPLVGGPAAYAETVSGTETAPTPGGASSTTLAPARPDPDLDDGDHDRMAHIVLEGYTPTKGRRKGKYVAAGPSVVEGIVNRTAVRALCGKEWVPGRDPKRYGLCPTCKEIAESMGWKIPAS
jgi:Protein of unknown function (DUF3039)